MIKFKKFKDTTDSINACNHCHYGCNGTRDANNCGHWNECAGGYFINQLPKPKRTRPRKSRDRRLLEALLKCVSFFKSDETIYTTNTQNHLTVKQAKQLIAIKEQMKGGK